MAFPISSASTCPEPLARKAGEGGHHRLCVGDDREIGATKP